MKKFMDWMTDKFAPRMNKLARNPWIASVQEAILTAMPMIFIGSFTTVLTAFGGLIEGFPDFSPLSTFSLGLLSLYLAYLVPYLLMEKKRLLTKTGSISCLIIYRTQVIWVRF